MSSNDSSEAVATAAADPGQTPAENGLPPENTQDDSINTDVITCKPAPQEDIDVNHAAADGCEVHSSNTSSRSRLR